MALRPSPVRRASLALTVLVGLSAFTLGGVDRWAAGGELGLEQAAASPPTADAPPAQPLSPAELGAQIDATLKKAGLLGANSPVKVGIAVVDLASGETLYSHDGDVALNPASNTKLVTTAAALSLLGPEHRYATRVWAEGPVVDGVVSGKLYLQGGGDPSLVTGELYEIAGQLLAAGVTRVKGPIVVDAGRFDHDGLPPGFDQKDEFASHRAPGGAMSVNYNTYEIHAAAAAAAGGPPQLVLEPPVSDIVLENQAKTVAGKRNKLWFSSADKGGKTVVTVHGEIGVEAARASYRYPVSDPSRYAGELLALALKQRGVKLDKATISTGDVPEDAELLATYRSETLSELCRGVNKYSNNFMAEQILRTLVPGDGATAAAALDLVRQYTRDAGMDQRGLVIGNGSGLYANNLISAQAMTQLLAHVYADFRIRSDFMASLAIMGRDGTTRSRLDDSDLAGWIRVKTGTLDDVSALSGYVGGEGRDPIAFSIIMNGLDRKQRGEARAVQDQLAVLIAGAR